MSLLSVPTKLFFSLSWHTINLFFWYESQLTTLSLSLCVYPAGTWFFALLCRGQTRTGGVKKMHSFLLRQHTSKSALPCVPAPTGQGVLYLLCRILHRSLPQTSRNQRWGIVSFFSLPEHTECLSTY